MFYAPYENLSFFDLLHTVLSYMWKSLILLCFSHLITPHVKILILLCFTDRAVLPHMWKKIQLCFAHRITPHIQIHFYSYCLHTVLPHIWNIIILLCFAHHNIPHFDMEWVYEQIIKDELIIVLFLYFILPLWLNIHPF